MCWMINNCIFLLILSIGFYQIGTPSRFKKTTSSVSLLLDIMIYYFNIHSAPVQPHLNQWITYSVRSGRMMS